LNPSTSSPDPTAAMITTTATARRPARHNTPAPITASTAIAAVPPTVGTTFMITVASGERGGANQPHTD
jgi:hypothetical protein